MSEDDLRAEVRILTEHIDRLNAFVKRQSDRATQASDNELRAMALWLNECRRTERALRLADDIERGKWGKHWREINVHGAIRAALREDD